MIPQSFLGNLLHIISPAFLMTLPMISLLLTEEFWLCVSHHLTADVDCTAHCIDTRGSWSLWLPVRNSRGMNI